MRRPVVPLVGARDPVVDELVARCPPRGPSVIRALDTLTEPAGALGHVDAGGVGRRAGDMVDFPAPEEGTGHLPVSPVPVGGQHEGPLLRPDQHSHSGHASSPQDRPPPARTPRTYWRNGGSMSRATPRPSPRPPPRSQVGATTRAVDPGTEHGMPGRSPPSGCTGSDPEAYWPRSSGGSRTAAERWRAVPHVQEIGGVNPADGPASPPGGGW